MISLYVTAAVFGGSILIIQSILSVIGMGGDHDLTHAGHLEGHFGGHDGHVITSSGDPASHADHAHHSHTAPARGGLDLFSIRGLAAGIAFFGLAGLAANRLGWPEPVAAIGAAGAGLAAMIAVAVVMRSLMRLESTGSIALAKAVGETAEVYVPVPGDARTPGRVLLTLQGRTIECDAVLSGARATPLPTGSTVTVVDLLEEGHLVVTPTPNPLSDAESL